MSDRLAFLPQLKKNALTYSPKILLIFGDFSLAAILSFWVPRFLPPPDSHHAAQIWLMALAGFWLFTYETDSSFLRHSYLTYVRVLKVACFAALGYLLFFVITREFYSLRFLGVATLLWSSGAIILRFILHKFLPPLQILTLEPLPDILDKNNRICTTVVTDPTKINLAEFDFLLVDFRKQYQKEIQELLTHAHVARLHILSVPQLLELIFGKISIEHFSDSWVEATFYINPLYLRFKRLLDLVLTIVLAPLILLLCGVVALLILICMGRPILYWQERIGLDDKMFKMVKFRTMIPDAEKLGAASTEKNDSRVTPLGLILRKFRLDELPQFFNVIKGEMSIIGPRPEYSILVEDFMKNIPLFQIRHWLRPGITGWAQVNLGYAYASSQEEMKEKIRYDLFYLKNLSFWLDLIIICRTFMTILTGFGSR